MCHSGPGAVTPASPTGTGSSRGRPPAAGPACLLVHAEAPLTPGPGQEGATAETLLNSETKTGNA